MKKKKMIEVTYQGAARLVQAVVSQAVRDLEKPIVPSRERMRFRQIMNWHRNNAYDTLRWANLEQSCLVLFCDAYGYDLGQCRKKIVLMANQKLRRVDGIKYHDLYPRRFKDAKQEQGLWPRVRTADQTGTQPSRIQGLQNITVREQD